MTVKNEHCARAAREPAEARPPGLATLARRGRQACCAAALAGILALAVMPATAQEETWRINLNNADIQELVSQVANITGRTFVVDPRVRGRVTVISSANLTEEGIYELFLSVLRVHGFAAIDTGDVVRIQQQEAARRSGSPLDTAEEIDGEEIVTRVIPAEYVDAEELVQTLRPLVPQYGHLAAITRPNALIISDHAENVTRLMGIIERIDVADEDEIIMMPLQDAWVTDVVEMLERLAPDQIGQGAEGPQRVHVIANERTNNLVLKGKSRPIEDVRRLVEQLDQPARESDSTYVIQLSHADAGDLAEILSGLVSELGDGDSGPQPVRIQADPSLNAIIARADPNAMAEIREIIAQLDVRRTQVLIEAAIVEISIDDTLNYGIDMAAVEGDSSNVPLVSSALQGALDSVLRGIVDDDALPPPTGAIEGLDQPTLGVARIDPDGLSFGLVLQALATSTKADLLSTPSILTLDNQEAEIQVGQQVPFRTGAFTTRDEGTRDPFTTIERRDIGLTLRVTPHIHDDGEEEGGTVRLQVAQEVENVAQATLDNIGAQGFSDIVTSRRTIQTTVLADDRQTVVLGGLIQDDIQDSERRVPILGSMPLIGRLFRSTNQEQTKRNLVVFLRPTIIRTREDAAAATERKYSGIWETELRSSDGDGEEGEEESPPMERLYEGRTR